VSCFFSSLARRSAATLLGFFAVTMTEGIVAWAGGRLIVGHGHPMIIDHW
jgi:hypothetical protein